MPSVPKEPWVISNGFLSTCSVTLLTTSSFSTTRRLSILPLSCRVVTQFSFFEKEKGNSIYSRSFEAFAKALAKAVAKAVAETVA